MCEEYAIYSSPLHTMLSPTRPGFNFLLSLSSPLPSCYAIAHPSFPAPANSPNRKGEVEEGTICGGHRCPPPSFSLAETFRFPFLFPLHLRAERGRGEGAWEGGRRDRPTYGVITGGPASSSSSSSSSCLPFSSLLLLLFLLPFPQRGIEGKGMLAPQAPSLPPPLCRIAPPVQKRHRHPKGIRGRKMRGKEERANATLLFFMKSVRSMILKEKKPKKYRREGEVNPSPHVTLLSFIWRPATAGNNGGTVVGGGRS